MTIFTFANNINTTLAGAVSPSATTITLASTANLPASIPAGEVLVITLNDVATRQNFEIVYATARTGATLTVLRAQEGTAALSWLTGDFAYSPPTAGQQQSFGQLGGANTWTGANTFSSPVSVGAAVTAGEAVNLGQFLSSIGTNGFLKIPTMFGGSQIELIVQWGSSVYSTQTTSTVTLPTPFTTAFLQVVASVGENITLTSNAVGAGADPQTLSTFLLSVASPTSGTTGVHWIAIGY